MPQCKNPVGILISAMQLLPTIIIVSLLGFFIFLTLILFVWQYLRTRERHRRRRTSNRPIRRLTVRSGKVIPKSEAADTVSTRDPISVDLPSPNPTYTVTCQVESRNISDIWRSKGMIHGQGHSSQNPDLEAQIDCVRIPALVESESHHPRKVIAKPRRKSVKTIPMEERSGSLTLPRPPLVNIESRRPSTTSQSQESHSRRQSNSRKQNSGSRQCSTLKGRVITNSLEKAYVAPLILGGEVHQLPSSPMPRTSSIYSSQSRWASGRRPSGQTLDGSSVSSRGISDSVQRPPPLFSSVGDSPHVRFVPPAIENVNRMSFLSMTHSASSSVTPEQTSPLLTPVPHAPPPSMVELGLYEPSQSKSEEQLLDSLVTPSYIRDTPPHLDTPEFGSEITFFNSATSSKDSNEGETAKKLKRGVSVMSNRSNFTIASSEISSTWYIENARAVNIYPSVAQDRDRVTPSYARGLRSKYGRYPRGRRDKALPVIPRSPLSQSEPEPWSLSYR